MNKLLAFAGTAALAVLPAQATINYSNGYGGITEFTHSTADAIVSFDRAGGETYYMTSTAGFAFSGLWTASSGTALVTTANRFSGSSVVGIGDYVYYNSSEGSPNFTQHIDAYGPISGSGTGFGVSTASNFTLAGNGSSNIFIAGFGASSNEIFYAPIGAGGTLTAAPTSLGAQAGFSGPLTFDASGNLYYASGSTTGTRNIYKWSAAEVADAIADPGANPLLATNVWLDFGALFAGYAGTSLAFDENGDLLLTINDFMNPTMLIEFDVDNLGDYGGSFQEVLSNDGRSGQVRNIDGAVYYASDNQILRIVPEPGTGALVLAGAALALLRRRRNG